MVALPSNNWLAVTRGCPAGEAPACHALPPQHPLLSCTWPSSHLCLSWRAPTGTWICDATPILLVQTLRPREKHPA